MESGMVYLQRETNEQHPISRQNLCKKLNECGISSNPRTLSLDIEVLNSAGYEMMECQIGRKKYYYFNLHSRIMLSEGFMVIVRPLGNAFAA